MERVAVARNVALGTPRRGYFVMAAVLLVMGFYLIWPIALMLINSFNAATDMFVEPHRWGLDHWQAAYQQPGELVRPIFNSFLIWSLSVGVSFPIGITIAWFLARTKVPFSYSLEFMFWIAYMVPGLPVTIAWMTLLDPDLGLINQALTMLPFIEEGPFNIFSVPGIVWVGLMGNGIALKVMLLTPAFRNMDAAMEEAARVSGATNMRTAFRVTLPLMISPITLIFALQLLRIFQSFETEWLLGLPFGFFVYSTKIFSLVRTELPNYGEATALASLTLMIIAVIIPLQRWILERRRYTTITGNFKPGLIDIGPWNYVVFSAIALLLLALTVLPFMVLVLAGFMRNIGYFELGFTLDHWRIVLSDSAFLDALRTTLVLGFIAAVGSPLLFSLIAYILVRTRLPGRGLLDFIIWGSGAVPGILSGLGLLLVVLGTPGLSLLYGTIWILFLVVVMQGNTTGVNILKGVFVQVGQDMEDAARVSGAGWIRTYFQIWIPLLMPMLVLLAVINFTSAATATSSVILLASRDTWTLSILALVQAGQGGEGREVASIISLFIIIISVTGALAVRYLGLRLGIRHDRPVLAAGVQLQPADRIQK
jgi:iron(III) transport system permease protein